MGSERKWRRKGDFGADVGKQAKRNHPRDPGCGVVGWGEVEDGRVGERGGEVEEGRMVVPEGMRVAEGWG